MRKARKGLIAVGLTAGLCTAAYADGMFSTLPIIGSASFCASTVTGAGGLLGSICAQTVPAGPPALTGLELIPADYPGGAGPTQNVAIPSGLLGGYPITPRNLLDNSAFIVQQRGTGAVTCATTGGLGPAAATAYGPDRWGCVGNVTSGQGRMQIVTSSPTPPVGFQNVVKVWRNSAALTQPVCAIQAVPSADVIAAVGTGRQLTLSFQAAALAGLAADNNNLISAVVVTGTGTDEGLGSFTASPAITPAFTGVATPVNQTIPVTTTFSRYSVSFTPLSTVTELAVELCFTPTATGAGATDGFAFVGAQLEVAPSPTPYEWHSYQWEFSKATRYFYAINEPATAIGVGIIGSTATTSTCQTTFPFPQVMRVAPTFTSFGTALSGSTWKINNAAATTVLATTFYVTTTGNAPNAAYGTWTVSGTPLTAGQACYPVGANGGNILTWSADL